MSTTLDTPALPLEPPTGRALATVETITALRPIEGADLIVAAQVRGWQVVVKADEFAVGDLCVYFEVDSMLPVADPRLEFLAPRGVRTDGTGRRGYVLKTARLRGAYSQGLAMPIGDFPEIADAHPGQDVTDLLDVHKWEPPVPVEMSGKVRGSVPGWIGVTDEERLQNVPEKLAATGGTWVATEKIDGTSTTFYVDPTTGHRGVCSHHWDLEPGGGATLWEIAAKHQLHEKIAATWPGVRAAVQGETYGQSIQGNPLKVNGRHLAIFTVNVDGVRLPRTQWPSWALELSVPEHPELTFPATVEQALADVEKLTSKVNPSQPAEGIVWRAEDTNDVLLADGQRTRASFKVISNRYLLKHDR